MMTKLKTVLTFLLAAVLLGLSACTDGDDTAVEPTPTPEAVEKVVYTIRGEEVPYYTAPLSGFEYTAGTVTAGTQVQYLDAQGDYVQVQLPTGHTGWVHSWYVVASDPIAQRQLVVNFVRSRTQSDTFEVMVDEPVYTCMAGLLNCRSLPGTTGVILTQIEFGDEVRVIGKDKDFYLVYLEDGSAVYCAAEYLEEQATYVDLDGAVDLRVYMPGAEFDLVFAGTGNVTGEALYPEISLLEESTAKMLMEAYKIFREDGYTIKIYDAYHPQSAQSKLKAAGQSETGSGHSYGTAVDIYLVNMYTGKELEMPTTIYNYNGSALRSNSEKWTANSRANIAYITDVMTSVGFEVSRSNWWHFENPNPTGKLDIELDWESLTYLPISQYVSTEEIINPQPSPQQGQQEGE